MPEIWAGALGQWKPLTKVNDGLKSEWGELKSLRWAREGFTLQGWLMYPVGYDPKQHYPMVVVVHGGPASTSDIRYKRPFFNMHTLSTRGYFVFYPNPRGSFGQGQKFTQANRKDFGYGDLSDILAGMDEVMKALPIDPKRIGITGWSYGGYMTLWAITQTNRFAAAVAGAGMANFQSYYSQNGINQWLIPYFGASVYDDPAIYARSSPLTFIKNVKTPTLLVVGELDGESPAAQSREYWYALNTLGVPTELVIYPGEGHWLMYPDHRRDLMDRTVGWFDRYLKE